MASLRTGALDRAERVPSSSALSAPDTAELAPARPVTLMRKYEVSALVGGGSIVSKQVVAPALRCFEETASAFARGSLVATIKGPVAVEDLLPGDYVVTPRGPEPVVWIGSTTFVPGITNSTTSLTRLVRITADSHGLGRPMGDLLVGPAARMQIRRDRLQDLIGNAHVLAPVADFIDGERIIEISPPGSVQLYHVALARHTTLTVGGFEMESYHPGRNAAAELGQNMRSLFLSMFPNFQMLDDFGDLTLTRTTREVIDNLA